MRVGQAMAEAALQASESSKVETKDAAQQFEALLLQQLLKVMRTSTPVLQGEQAGMYMSMLDSALADHLSEVGGVGLSSTFERAIGGGAAAPKAESPQKGFLPLLSRSAAALDRYQALSTPGRLRGEVLPGETGRLQEVAGQLLSQGAKRWAREGRLGPGELRSTFRSEAQDGAAHFNVRDASGYEGHPKCNLFALELARRSGFKVPLIPREAGWGFPSADAVTAAAREGRLSWGHVATGVDGPSLDHDIAAGRRAFLLTGSGSAGRHGHMAIVERIRRVEYDSQGEVTQIEFDGWEARSRGGAEHLQSRTWNRLGTQGGHLPRSGFDHIEIIELERANPGETIEQPQSLNAPPSFLDNFFSSSSTQKPNHSSEDAS